VSRWSSALALLDAHEVRVMARPAWWRGRRGVPGSFSARCAAALPGEPAWSGAVAALAGLLASAQLRGARLDVVLAGEFARVLVVPWDASLRTAPEEQAWLEHHFRAAFSTRAAAWVLAADRAGSVAGAGGRRVCAAADRDLLARLAGDCASAGVRLGAVEPLLCAALGRVGIDPQADGVVAVLESGRGSAAHVSGGAVQQAVSRRLAAADPVAGLEAMVRTLLAGAGAAGGAPVPVYLVGAQAPAMGSGGIAWRRPADGSVFGLLCAAS
jgi:hypothetical protein